MEDLYSNLENYDDVNAVDELKNENRELKIKLEECSKTMNQLQKDFDKLNSEYKKLEINYSSLLKTARAEIERKTQLITNLNKEKDMIVIRAMQGGCRNILKNLNKPVNNCNKNNFKSKNEENNEILDKNRAGLSGNSREGSRESHLHLMKDNSTAPFTNRSSSSSDHNARQLDDGYRKENKSAQNQKHNNDKTKSMKISDRRKSMPGFSNGEEVTSEDDVIKNDFTNTRDCYKYQDYDNASHNSQFAGSKCGQRTSRFELYNREQKKNIYNREKDRYNPHFDKYKSHNQNYDNYSPERGRQRQQRGNDYLHRSEHYRQRELESPPRNKYGRSKSRDRRHRDSRWERYEDNYHDAGNIREPDHKRRRMDSGNSEWERHDQAAERMSHRPSEYRPDIGRVDHSSSCQSPDYDQIESNLNHHSIKEIKNTASVQLEDPRINSNKYSLRESERGVYIATVDKNVDMIPVDKTLWGFEKVEVPEALKTNVWKEPANDDIVNYIYMDIDDPTNVLNTKYDDNIAPETLQNFVGQDECRIEQSTQDITEQKPQKTNIPTLKSIPNNYKIPKKSNIDKKSSVQEKIVKNDYNHRNNIDTLGKVKHFFKNEAIEDKIKLKAEKLAPVDHNVQGDLELSDEASDVTDELQITCKQNDKLTLVSDNESDRNINGRRENDNIQQSAKPRIGNIMTITKDNNDVIRKMITEDHAIEKGNIAVIKASIDNSEKMQLYVEKEKSCKEEVSDKKLDICKKKTVKKKQDGETPRNKDVKSTEQTNENLEMESKEKKKREKRKRLLSKETVQEKQECKVTHTNIGNNEDKPKSSKPRSKFTELFGDSSSLITPEDLNLPTKLDVNVERNDNYGSLFENTQDAIDINVRDIKVTPKISNSNKEVIENIEALAIDENSQDTVNKKSLFVINTDHPVANMFENLKPANDDDESNIVKTVVISSGIQPCLAENNSKERNIIEGEQNSLKTFIIPNEKQSYVEEVEENNTNQKKIPEVEINIIKTVISHTGVQPCIEEKNRKRANLTEEDVQQQPLSVPKLDSLQLKAIATSTPNKMQHDLSIATSSVPNSEILDNDSNLSYSASLATTNVEANSDAPDVRIFIKRRRKIKKT